MLSKLCGAILVALALYSSDLHAQTSHPFSGFNFLVAGHGLYGSGQSNDGLAVPSRSMGGFGASVVAGARVSTFFFGLGAGLSRWEQLKDPKMLDQVNLSGNLTQISAALGLSLGNYSVLGKYHVNSVYQVGVTDVSGNEVNYVKGYSPFSFSVLRAFGSSVFAGLEYFSQGFKSIKVAGAETPGSLNRALKLQGYGLTFGFYY